MTDYISLCISGRPVTYFRFVHLRFERRVAGNRVAGNRRAEDINKLFSNMFGDVFKTYCIVTYWTSVGSLIEDGPVYTDEMLFLRECNRQLLLIKLGLC